MTDPPVPEEPALKLRRMWGEHRRIPFPAAGTGDPRLQEIALYETWLGSVIEATLDLQGRVAASHERMLEVRRREGNQALWAAAGELGHPFRAYVARLLAIEDLLVQLPLDE